MPRLLALPLLTIVSEKISCKNQQVRPVLSGNLPEPVVHAEDTMDVGDREDSCASFHPWHAMVTKTPLGAYESTKRRRRFRIVVSPQLRAGTATLTSSPTNKLDC